MRFAFAAIVAGLLTAPQEPVTVHFLMWKPHQPEAYEKIFADFHKAHSNIRVQTEIGPHSSTEFHAMLVTKLRARDPALDVFLADVVWPAEFAAAGYLDALDDVLPEAERKAFFPGTIEANTVGGTLVAAPFNIDAGLLYYRKDLLEEAGLEAPETWEALAAAAAKVREKHPNLAGYTGQFDRYEGLVCNMLEFIEGNGGTMVRDGAVAFDAKAEEALAWVRDRLIGQIAPRSVLNQREPESREVFLQGDAVFHRNWPETWNILNDPARSKVAGKVGLARLPRFEGGKSVSTLGGWQLAVAAHTPRKEAARTLVRYLTGLEGQKKLTLWTAQSHSRIEVMEDAEVLKAFPHFADLKEVLLAAAPRPRLPNYAEVSDRLQGELYRRIKGESGEEAGTLLPAAVAVLALVVIVVFLARGRRRTA